MKPKDPINEFGAPTRKLYLGGRPPSIPTDDPTQIVRMVFRTTAARKLNAYIRAYRQKKTISKYLEELIDKDIKESGGI